ncbi:hypothetical protein KDW_54090 [Dictyobacter vulcani]|uniref:N-acetyltransferase domain-containing protein n=1 Tax=Dictyobacter vulcani TaxID=2607529 RepID=A0A5J4KXI0_9CHLR|nr:GNAT family N-acetyltransferase [Dictyobacter vulcani]GER91247.1 hypothetical protein KDW_54090 [Dictyobacter vulcani]
MPYIVYLLFIDGEVAGYVSSYQDKEPGKPEVTYWIGKSYWGKGVATRGLTAFLLHYTVRPIYARAAKDNIASLRVLEKCGFIRVGENRDFASGRGQETEELILQLPLRGMLGI